MTPRVTIRDVAARAGVSVTTASRAMNDTGRMKAETRDLIRAVALDLGYRPNSIARALVQSRSATMGLLTNDTYGRFTLPVATGLSQVMVNRGVSVFLAATQDDPALTRLNYDALEQKQVEGLIIANRRTDRVIDPPQRALHIPTVYVMSACPAGAIGFNPDDTGGARTATEHLIALGRRRIAHVTGPHDFASARERARGWTAALRAVDLAPWMPPLFGSWSEAHGYAAARQLLGGSEARPDAVFCGNDQIARGFIDGATTLGVRVPDDVAVVGYDNWEIFAAATRPPLTTIDMELMALGRAAGLALLDLIDGKEVAAGERRLPCALVVRGSCGGEEVRRAG
jgi:LacI family transcriptional regulator